MEADLDKYDENVLLKIGIIISMVFIGMIVILYSGIKLDFSKLFEKEKSKPKDNTVNIQPENTVVSNDIAVNTEGRVVITLPGGVSEKNSSINKDIIGKKIVIAFPKGAGTYELENVVNNAEVVNNIDINVSEVMVKIEMSLSSIRDCKICFDNGQIFVDFFDPALVETTVIVIDPGHGGDDVGAIENGVYEKDIDLQISGKLKKLLENENILVYYTREDDSYPSVEERVDFSNSVMPDLFISIHSNWYDYDNVSGTSVLYNVKDTSQFSSAWLSDIMCQEIVKTCGTNSKGIINGNDIHIVRNSKVPVALIETGFMSNESDFKMLTTAAGQEKIAEGIYNGIIRSLTELGKY